MKNPATAFAIAGFSFSVSADYFSTSVQIFV